MNTDADNLVLQKHETIAEATEILQRELVTRDYMYEETGRLVQLVKQAANLLSTKGEGAFNEFRVPGSRWRQGETYIFVLDSEGNMLVHADAELEGKNQIDLKDVNGKPV